MSAKTSSKLGTWLRKLQQVGESNRAFAERLGISYVTLGRIYEGKNVDNSTLQKIADSAVHNLGIDEIFRMAGALPPAQRSNMADREVRRILDDLESLKGTPVYEPLVRALRTMVDVTLSMMDQAD